MSTFHEVQFSPQISYGAVGGPGFKTTILPLSSGYEQRNVDWSAARGTWDVSHGLKTQEQLDVLLAFFYARRGRAYGFRFKDWSDYMIPAPGDPPQALGVTDGTTGTYQLVKVYGDSAASYRRTILKPVASTTVLLVDGVPSSNFSLDTTTGILTLGDATRARVGATLAYSGQFDVPVRFDVDDMKVSIEDYEIFNWGQIAIVELKGGS